MEELAVSVIVPCYNQQQYIKQCIDSVLMQKIDFPIEILVGDDASSDGTPAILKEYALQDDRIKLVLREKNIGATSNNYDLFMRARGRYLAYLEGDDFWTDPEKLALQYHFLEENTCFIGCYHKIHLVDITGKRIDGKLSWIRYKKVYRYKDFDGYRIPGHSMSWLRRNVFLDKKNNYSDIYKISKNIGDRTAALFFLSKGDFGLINRDMAAYRYLREENKGISASVYHDIESSLNEELDLLNRLCVFSNETLNRPIRLMRRKYQLFFRALVNYLQNRTERSKELLGLASLYCKNKTILFLSLLSSSAFYIKKKLFFIE